MIDEGTEAVAGALEEPFKESRRSHRANSQLLDLALGLLGHSSWSGTNACAPFLFLSEDVYIGEQPRGTSFCRDFRIPDAAHVDFGLVPISSAIFIVFLGSC